MCRKEFTIPAEGVKGLQHNFFLDDLISMRNTGVSSAKEGQTGGQGRRSHIRDKCEGCGGETGHVATAYCVDCGEKLCDGCGARCRNRRAGAHQVVKLGDAVKPELMRQRSSYCEWHSDELVKMYCCESQCKANICTVCYAVKHKGHECLEIQDVATELVQQIDQNIQTLGTSVTYIEKEKSDVEVMRKTFIGGVKKAEIAVRQKGEELVKLIHGEVERLVQTIQAVQVKTEKEIDVRHEELELIQVAVESFINYSTEVRDKGRPCDITRIANDLNTRASELKKMTSTVSQYQPPTVTFTPAGASVLDKLGGIRALIGEVTVKEQTGNITAPYVEG